MSDRIRAHVSVFVSVVALLSLLMCDNDAARQQAAAEMEAARQRAAADLAASQAAAAAMREAVAAAAAAKQGNG
jgi:hypothetical protein